jgi:hypothetical protein
LRKGVGRNGNRWLMRELPQPDLRALCICSQHEWLIYKAFVALC